MKKKNDEDLVSRIHILIIKPWNSSFLLISWLFSSFRFSSLAIDMNLCPSRLVMAVGHIYSRARLVLKGRTELCPWACELTSQVELSPRTQDFFFFIYLFFQNDKLTAVLAVLMNCNGSITSCNNNKLSLVPSLCRVRSLNHFCHHRVII